MGRLTDRYYDVTNKKWHWSIKSNSTNDGLVATPQDILDKLAHYEVMEEQGRLIEQKQGYWIKSRKYYDDGYTVIGACSVCGLEFQAKLLRKICYCPHCGAKMVAEAKLKELEGGHIADVRKMMGGVKE